ncbi:MAG: hypothetical protein RL385_6131, partial [Pseudomonadota bacterium]
MGERLRQAGVQYVDQAGDMHVQLSSAPTAKGSLVAFVKGIVQIGAGALRIHNKLTRFTADLDIAVVVEAPPYPGPLAEHPAWRRDALQHQRWKHATAVEIDVLPAGPQLRAQGHVTWPGGHRMSLAGFSARFGGPLALGDAALRIEVASVALIMLLKMVDHLTVHEPPLDVEAHASAGP